VWAAPTHSPGNFSNKLNHAIPTSDYPGELNQDHPQGPPEHKIALSA
jgi:hypothetical protein